MTVNGLTLGRVLDRFDQLYPNDIRDGDKRRIIWMVDKAFAVETGQDEPTDYRTAPKTTALLVPRINKELYFWAMLRDMNKKKQSEGVTEYYSERYTQEKKEAVAAWLAAKKGGIDIESFM